MITFPFEALDPNDPTAGLKRAKKISTHTTFFKAGICLGRTLVSVVKSTPLSSTIKTLEPIDQNVRGRSKPTFRKLLQGGADTLRVFKVCVEKFCGLAGPVLTRSLGILYPRGIKFVALSQDEALRWLFEGIRDRRS